MERKPHSYTYEGEVPVEQPHIQVRRWKRWQQQNPEEAQLESLLHTYDRLCQGPDRDEEEILLARQQIVKDLYGRGIERDHFTVARMAPAAQKLVWERSAVPPPMPLQNLLAAIGKGAYRRRRAEEVLAKIETMPTVIPQRADNVTITARVYELWKQTNPEAVPIVENNSQRKAALIEANYSDKGSAEAAQYTAFIEMSGLGIAYLHMLALPDEECQRSLQNWNNMSPDLNNLITQSNIGTRLLTRLDEAQKRAQVPTR